MRSQKAILSPVRPFDGEALWAISWLVDVRGIPGGISFVTFVTMDVPILGLKIRTVS